jgi:hypothetical protein
MTILIITFLFILLSRLIIDFIKEYPERRERRLRIKKEQEPDSLDNKIESYDATIDTLMVIIATIFLIILFIIIANL